MFKQNWGICLHNVPKKWEINKPERSLLEVTSRVTWISSRIELICLVCLLRIRSNYYIVILMIDLLLLLLCITYNLVRFLCIYKPTAVGTTPATAPDVTFTNASGATESTCCCRRTHSVLTLRLAFVLVLRLALSVYSYSVWKTCAWCGQQVVAEIGLVELTLRWRHVAQLISKWLWWRIIESNKCESTFLFLFPATSIYICKHIL